MIKNRLRNLVIFLITTGLILILNSGISFSQDTDTQNAQNVQRPCQESESCVFLDDQFLFGIYPDVSDEGAIEKAKEMAKKRAKIVSETIESIAYNLRIDTNQILTYESDTCSTDDNDVQTCQAEAILAYIASDGETENIIKFNQQDVIQTNTQEKINIESPIDLAKKYKKTIQTTINLYRNSLINGRGNPILTGILFFSCFVVIVHQLFWSIFCDLLSDFIDLIIRFFKPVIGIFNFFKSKPYQKNYQETECKIGNKTKDGLVIKEVYFRTLYYVIYRTKNTIKWDVNETNINDNNIEDNNIEDNNIEDNNIEDNNIEDNNIEDNNCEENHNKIHDSYMFAILKWSKWSKSLAFCFYWIIMLKMIRLEILNWSKNTKEELLNTLNNYYNQVQLELKEELLNTLNTNYNQVQSELSEIESKQPGEIQNTETINIVVAHGIKLALDGEINEAKKVFKQADQRLDNFRQKYNTIKYLNGSFMVVVSFLLAISSMVILPRLFPDLFDNIFTILSINTQFIPVIIYGSLEGFLSVSYRIGSAGLDIQNPDSNFRILGASRIYIAVISSIFIYAVLKADIINGTGTLLDVDDPEMSLYRIAFFSAVAGFVEGFIPDILDTSASKFSKNGEADKGQDPKNPPEGK